ncbi:nucleotidyltransferase family protein [Neobacillus drentensis]|uniref:nucleotidyltransferase family protein n=1 Tax=Neobacillus drentensis TaxID=220684 RepID=UPI002FFE43C2
MDSNRSFEVYGIVPASGFSRRMGRQKLLLSWKNKPLLEHVLRTANNSSLNGVLTVIPADDEERKKLALQTNSKVIYNKNPEKGIGFSLALGMMHIPKTADAVMIFLGDQPELKQDDIQIVLNRFNEIYSESNDQSKIIVQTHYINGKIGHPILFSKPFFSELSLLDGDQGGNHIIHSNIQYLTRVNSIYRYPPDIDTIKDYDCLLNRQ